LASCFDTYRNKIDGLTPRGRFLRATGGYDSRQQCRRVLPADQVEAPERLVDEVERVPVVCERLLGRGRKRSVGEQGGFFTRRKPALNFSFMCMMAGSILWNSSLLLSTSTR
jgi:hypothetical protein